MNRNSKFHGITLLILLGIILAACTNAGVSRYTENTEIPGTELELMKKKIDYYTRNTFRFLEEVKVDDKDQKVSVTVSLIPEVGSAPIKDNIYKSLAAHALDINKFFPEVNNFTYIVLWDERKKEQVIRLIIDENTVEKLSSNYATQMINENGGVLTDYSSIFTSIEELGEATDWRERAEK